jgi:serine/threonine-protein kinase RsbW
MEVVSITVPASPEYLHVVRLVAAGLASRLDFTLDEIEDLKIAVDELASYVTGPHGRDGKLSMRFEPGDTHITISGVGLFQGAEGLRTQLTDFSRMILETVADSATLEGPDGVLQFALVKSTRQ